MKIVQHESIETEQNLEKSEKEECTIVHKRITGRPLTDRYTLVFKNETLRGVKISDQKNFLP